MLNCGSRATEESVIMADIFTYLTAFGFGLSASFYPCLFPVLPSYIAFVSTEEGKQAILNGLVTSVLVTLGIMTVFVGMGMVFSSVVGFFADNYENFRFLQGILLVILGGLLIFGISFNITKVWEVSAFAHDYISRFHNPWFVAYLIGLFFALLAAPCALIVFLATFTLIAGEGLITTVMVMVLFSVGAGIPFVIIGVIVPALKKTFEEKFITSKNVLIGSNKINRFLPRVVGVLILLTGVALVLGIDTFDITEWPLLGNWF